MPHPCASCITAAGAGTLPASPEPTKSCSLSLWRTRMVSGRSRSTTPCIESGTKASVARSAHSARRPGQEKKYQNLRRQRRTTVQDDIADGAGSRRDARLMPFVPARHQGGHEESNGSPAQGPSRSPRQTQRRAPRPKQEEAQGKIAHEMAAFSDVVMHYLEARQIQTDEKMKQWKENSAGVFGRKPISGLDRDERHPQKRSNPGLK